VIYVLATQDRASIKIGFSKERPVERCEQIEEAHPGRLTLLTVMRGDKNIERHFQKRFDKLRMPSRREWFKNGHEIKEWLRTEEDIIKRPFYEWLIQPRDDDSQLGKLARSVMDEDTFPTRAKTYFPIEDYFRGKGVSIETLLIFDEAWREFLRQTVRHELGLHPIDVERIGKLDRSFNRARILDVPTRVAYLFDSRIPLALLERAERAREVDTLVCFKIEEVGEWTIDCSQQVSSPSCVRGCVDGKASCTIEMGVAAFASMLEDVNAGMRLYFRNELCFSGDLSQVSKIGAIFALVRP